LMFITYAYYAYYYVYFQRFLALISVSIILSSLEYSHHVLSYFHV